mgnify:CR=1 FL=1
MEWSRKGKAHKKGFKPDQLEAFEKRPTSRILHQACTTLQYLFPKAHAVAYVLSAYRIAYCKVHHPKEFYAAYFTVRAPHFDFTLVHKGLDYMKRFIQNVTPRHQGLGERQGYGHLHGTVCGDAGTGLHL